jgi:hypothetical protein
MVKGAQNPYGIGIGRLPTGGKEAVKPVNARKTIAL